MDYDRPFIVTRTGFRNNRLSSEALQFLKVEKVPNEYRGAHILLVTFFQSTPMPQVVDLFQQLVNIICYGQGPTWKHLGDMKRVLGEIFSQDVSNNTVSRAIPLFSVLVYHLALQGKISLPPAPLFTGPRAGQISITPWFKKLPDEVQFWCVVSDRRYLEKLSDSLDPRMCDLAWEWYRENENTKLLSAAAILMRHYFAYKAVKTFDLSLFVENQRLNSALTNIARTPQPILWIYSRIRDQDLSALFQDQLAKTVLQISTAIPQIYQSEIIESRRNSGLSDPYDLTVSSKLTGIDHGLRRHRAARIASQYKRSLPTKLSTKYGDAEYARTYKSLPDGCSVYRLSSCVNR
jgi:hypothetical protein